MYVRTNNIIPPVSGKGSVDLWCWWTGWGGGGLDDLRSLGSGKRDPIEKCWLKRASITPEAVRGTGLCI